MNEMIGTRIKKPLEDSYNYAAVAAWCNENSARIEDRGDYYEVCAVVLPEVSPAQARDMRLAEFKVKSDAITYAVREEYPTDEVISWSKQEAEARAYLADNSAPTPLLSAIAENRSIPLALLAEKVTEKADVYAIFTGQIFGIRQALEDRLRAIDLDAPDAIDQINAIVWPEG